MSDLTPPDAPPVEASDESLAGASHDTAMRNIGNELVATTLLMLAGPGLIVLSSGPINTLAAALAFGGAIAIAIGVLGAVANPAFSLALRFVREITPAQMIQDWIGQFAGGIIGAAMIWGINDQTRSAVGANGWDVGRFRGPGAVIAAELVFTVVVVVVLLSAISQGRSKSAIAAFTGIAYSLGMLVLLNVSGGGMNPARSLGSAIFTDTNPSALGQVIVFIVIPFIAAIAAVFIWLAIDDAEVDHTIFDETFIDDLGDAIDGTDD